MKVEKRVFTITEEERQLLIQLTTEKRNLLIRQGKYADACDSILNMLMRAKLIASRRQVKLLEMDWKYLVIRVLYDERQRRLETGGPVDELADLTLHIMGSEQRLERYREKEAGWAYSR